MQTATALQPRRTFQDLQDFALTARQYREIRKIWPAAPARTALEYIREDGAGCLNFGQFICQHRWNMTPAEADECGGNIRCVRCDLDGDA